MTAITSAASAAAAALSIRSRHRSATGGGMPPGSAATAAANRAIRPALSSGGGAAIGLAGTGLGIIGLSGGIAVVIDLMTFTSCGGCSRCGAGFADAVRGSLTITGAITDRGRRHHPAARQTDGGIIGHRRRRAKSASRIKPPRKQPSQSAWRPAKVLPSAHHARQNRRPFAQCASRQSRWHPGVSCPAGNPEPVTPAPIADPALFAGTGGCNSARAML